MPRILSTRRARPLWFRILRLVVVGIIVFFVVRILIRHGGRLLEYRFEIDYRSLAAATLLLVLFYFCLGEMWRRILKAVGAPLPVWRNEAIYYYSSLSRYVPGKLWPVVGRLYLCGREGIGEGKTSASLVLEMVLNTGAALTVFLLSLPFWRELKLPVSPAVLLVLVPVCLIVLYPKILTGVLNYLLGKLKREPLPAAPPFTKTILLAAGYAALWVLQGAALYLFIPAFGLENHWGLLELTGMFCLAWAVGFLSFLTPAGLVVREGVLVSLLSLQMAEPWAPLLISVASRLWMVVTEVLFALVSMKIGFGRHA
jgi:uncharacterized membrane protein YbhN (UPF0104 family)